MKLRTRILVIVIAVIAIWALAVVPQWVQASKLSKQVFTKAALTGTAWAIYTFHRLEGRWPDSLDSLQKNDKGIMYINWGEYPEQDAWRRKIIYGRFDPSLGFGTVSSYGADGKPGGEGFAEDLEVHFGLDFPTWEQIHPNAPNPQGVAAGGEPFRSGTNSTSAAAGSRHSP